MTAFQVRMFTTSVAIAMTTVAMSAQEGARPVAVPPPNPPQQVPVQPPNRPRQVAVQPPSPPRQVTGELVNPTQQLSGFSVMLVEGDLRGASTAEDLTPSAAKALADLKDFLPYKSYRLLGTEWMLGSRKFATRLRGEGPQEYDLEMTVGQVYGYQQPATAARGGAVAIEKTRLQRRRVSVERFALREARALPTTVVDKADGGRMPSAYVGPGAVIDTSFTMDYGETVVVGTSRLQGSKALIVLLTAVAK
jgi:hypothetical protein